MRQRTFLVIVFGVAAVLIVGGLYAQNMAFKHDYKLLGVTNPASNSGQNSVTLPFIRLPFLNDAKNLLDDINSDSPSPNNVLQVAEWRPDQDGFVGYTGTSGTPFPLVSCEAYLVQVTDDVNYRIVGSHNRAMGCTFRGIGSTTTGEATTQVSLSGQNYYGYPYHSTAGNAKELLDEINTHAGALVVLQIAQWQSDQDGFIGYTGTSGSPFQLIPGEGYLIQVSVDVPNFVPSHF